jgi:apolipoprotein N-acyltransferase
MTFAFAPYEIYPLAILAMAGLLGLWLKAAPSPGYAGLLGFLFGFGLFGTGVYWVFIIIHRFGGVSVPMATLITLGLIAALSVFPATVGYCLNRYFPENHTVKLIYAFPALWVFFEWIRSWIFSGFPWLFVGYSQTNSPLRGYAPLLGVYCVSLAVALSSACIVNAIIQYKQRLFQSVYYNVLALALIWIVGAVSGLIPWVRPEGPPVSVALVQGNIPQAVKWSKEHLQLSFDRYTELTQPLWGKNQIIIWPEAAIPDPLQNIEPFINAMDDKASKAHSALILGVPIGTQDGTGYYNAIVTLGAQRSVYLKRHLVPFGEYTPFADRLANAFKWMDIPMSEMVSGKIDQGALNVGKIKIFPSICYEIAFPELSRFIDKSINLILVVTNDAWFGGSNAEPQHVQMATMRALESGRPVLFVSNDGITAIIGPDGTIEAALPQHQAAVLNATVQPTYGITPWMYNGLDPLLFILICFLIAAVVKYKQAERLKSPHGTETAFTGPKERADEACKT